MTTSINELLQDIVMEKGIVKIILEMKEDLENTICRGCICKMAECKECKDNLCFNCDDAKINSTIFWIHKYGQWICGDCNDK